MGKDKLVSLGLESTAHTFGIGIVDSEGEILADRKHVYQLREGIHPREAAESFIENFGRVINEALNQSGLKYTGIDLIAFSQGPGLPPTLRVGATVARTLSLKLRKPLVGVNHPIAHIEIGRLTTGAKDPLVVYVSGGNTQIIAYSGGRYRVFGETLDIALGNAIDMLGRKIGLKFPAGPKVDQLAMDGEWINLPYVVKGMDFSFSGILTEAEKKLSQGVKVEDICYSFEQTCFAMITEAAERAVAHTKKKELLLTGGVASAPMLRSMLKKMCGSRGIKFYVPSKKLCVDNGVMIAWTGILIYRFNGPIDFEQSLIKQKWRVDQVDIAWINGQKKLSKKRKRGKLIERGAEAVVLEAKWQGISCVRKLRDKKLYREKNLDLSLRGERTKTEALLIHKAKRLGVMVPAIYGLEMDKHEILEEKIKGEVLREVFNSLNWRDREKICLEIGRFIGVLHKEGVTHGDLTTSNVLFNGEKIYLIDFGLGKHSNRIEDFSVDLFVFKKSLENNHWQFADKSFQCMLKGYIKEFKNANLVIKQMEKLWRRGRYQERLK